MATISIEKVGQITSNEIKNFHSPIHFARDLENRLTHHVYDPMVEQNNGPYWSASLNCQTFTRSAIQYLNCTFPPNILISSDCIPSVVDMYMDASLLNAHLKEKYNEKLNS